MDVAVRRWEALTGKQAVLEGDGRSLEEIASAREKAPEESGAGEGNDGPH